MGLAGELGAAVTLVLEILPKEIRGYGTMLIATVGVSGAVAANLVAKEEPYRRGCHGELFTVPDSAIAQWMKNAGKIVLIDGCFLRCHGRVMENLVGEEYLIQFDALSLYGKYTDRFDIDSVPEEERKKTARLVADKVLAELWKEPISSTANKK